MIQIKDGNPDTVQIWLAYLRKHQYYGIGMKANMWEFGPVTQATQYESTAAQLGELQYPWRHLGQTKEIGTLIRARDLLGSQVFKQATGLTERQAVFKHMSS